MKTIMTLGPMPLGDRGDAYFCVCWGPEGLDLEAASSAEAALRTLLDRVGRSDVVCEPELALEAKRLGVRQGPLPLPMLRLKASLAIVVSHGMKLGGPELVPLLQELIDAAARFQAAFDDGKLEDVEPYEVEVTGALQATFEASIEQTGEDAHGLVLYRNRGAVERVDRAAAEGDDLASQREDALALLMGEEPDFVADAIYELTGEFFAPHLADVRSGQLGLPSTVELCALTAAVKAVTALSDGGAEGHGSVEEPAMVQAVARRAAPRALGPNLDFAAVGRNDPCPCGSGQKFKRCHLSATRPHPAPRSPLASSWHALDETLTAELLEFVARVLPPKTAVRGMEDLWGKGEPQLGLFVPWFLYEHRLDTGKTVAETFLSQRGANLPQPTAAWMDAQLATRMSVWEVLRVEKEKGLDAIDCFSGERCWIEEIAASRTLRRRDVLLGRVSRIDGKSLLIGLHGNALPPEGAATLMRGLGGAAYLGDPTRPPPSGPTLVRAWEDAVARMSLEAATPSRLLNTDGDELLLIEERFAIKRGKRTQVTELLAGLPDASLETDSRALTRIEFSRAGNAFHPSWERTLVGSAELSKEGLLLRTNSDERARALREKVLAVAAPHLTFKERQAERPPRMMGGQTLHMDAALHGQAINPESAMIEARRAWLDLPHPELGDRTPCAAVTDEAGRRAVHVLLRSLENQEARAEDPASVDYRRELGLNELGERDAHHELKQAIGNGTKISAALLDVAEPVLSPEVMRSPERARAALQLAVMIWNGAVLETEEGAALLTQMRGRLIREGGPVALFDQVLERKRSRHGRDLRRIGHFDVRYVDGNFTVVADGRVSEALEARLTAADLLDPKL